MPIFDQGYQHWSGELSGHSWRWLAIARHGVRVGMKNRLIRLVVMFAWLPAIALGFLLCVWGLLERGSDLVKPILSMLDLFDPEVIANPKEHRVAVWTLFFEYFLLMELRFSMILVLLVGPGLISQDMRFNAFPLYFSRPLRRIDYFLGKLGVIAAFLGMVLVIPSIIAYFLGLLFSLDITIVRDTFPLLLAAVGYGLVMSLVTGTVILALSSLTRNSRYVALLWLGVWFVSSITSMIVGDIAEENRRQQHQNRNAQALYGTSPPKGRTPAERQKEEKAIQDERSQIERRKLENDLRAAQSDWRPMISFTANLVRIGQVMLGTDAAWQKLSLNKPEAERQRYMLNNKGSQYPWHWSAALLATLVAVSAVILNFRVKSLDRLR